MHHRHLTHDDLSPAAIDDIIERGALNDWVRLARAIRIQPQGQVAETVRRICAARQGDAFAPAQSLAFWENYLRSLPQ